MPIPHQQTRLKAFLLDGSLLKAVAIKRKASFARDFPNLEGANAHAEANVNALEMLCSKNTQRIHFFDTDSLRR